MKTFAQTNIQLLNQMRQLEYSEEDLTAVHRGYLLAMQIFAGQYRPSGKPFICHLVGTASILSDQKAPIEIVTAGLLHAAYTFGEFGSGYRDLAEAKRTQLRQSIGGQAEELVAEYSRFPWDRQTVAGLPNLDFDRLPDVTRRVLLLRLANELEEHLDLGVIYCGDAERRRTAMNTYLAGLIDVSKKLQHESLASMLSEAFSDCMLASLGSLPTFDQPASFLLAPRSHRLRLGAKVNAFFEGRGRVILRTGLGWRRGNMAERKIKEAVDRWAVRPG
jgi:Domain of unknown function (DUF6817)